MHSACDNTSWATTNYSEMVSSNTTVNFIDYPYRHVAVSSEQQRLRLAQDLVNGGALDYYLIGRLDNHEDRSGFPAVREIFHCHAAHEDDCVNLRSCADVALLTGPEAKPSEFRGWFRFLAEGHVLFDTLLVERAPDLDWLRYRAIAVPDDQPLGDEVASRLDRLVREGGVLVGSRRAGFRDAELEERAQPAVPCLGLRRAMRVRDDVRSSYLRIEEPEPWRRLALTRLAYVDGPYVCAEYAATISRRLRLIPRHPYGPPERCYDTQATQHPGFAVSHYGRGQALYVPWLPGALCYRQGHTNTFAFAADLVEAFAGFLPVRGNLSPMAQVTLYEQRDPGYRLLHLVNASGHCGVTFHPPVAMSDVRIRLPDAPKPRAIGSLVTGTGCTFRHVDGALHIGVPHLGLFKALTQWYGAEYVHDA